MKRTTKYLSGLFIVIAVLFSSCGKPSEGNKEKKIVNVSDTVAVEVAQAELKDISITKTFSGTLEGEDQANVVAKIPERIVVIKVKVGDHVSAGQTIVELDKSGASSQFFQAQAGFQNTSKDLERMKALLKEGAISQQMLDGIQTQYDVAKANFEAAKSAVDLTTPISGIVTAVNSNVGDLATPGMPIITVANIRKMKVIFNAGEVDIPYFTVGQKAGIYSELKPSLIINGRISRISKSADIASRTFEIQSTFANTSDTWFKPGMFCKVNVGLKSNKSSLVIPHTSIVNQGDSKTVFVVVDGQVQARNVEVGITDGNVTEILSGVKDGESVVTVGMNDLKNGSKVYVANK
ncbi:MAG: efflux RND transporter periplasmic adaptor subunit [bacterium]